MKAIGLRMVQAGHRFSLGPARWRFERALRGCAAAQAARLRELVTSNADTAYGRAHRFDAISSVRDWQGRVPIVDYDDLESWVRRATAGEPRVLTAAPILVFERTGGSTAANKLVPYTARLFDEFAAATGPWLQDLYASFPGLRGTTSYWSISPATRQPERTRSGIPVGLDDDTEYFGPLERFALRQMLAVPPGVARIPDMEAWATCDSAPSRRGRQSRPDLGLASVLLRAAAPAHRGIPRRIARRRAGAASGRSAPPPAERHAGGSALAAPGRRVVLGGWSRA